MSGADAELGLARARRDQAIACAALSLLMALALVLSNFGSEANTERARAAVRQHNAMLAQLQQVLQNNTAELAQDEAALASLRRAAHR